MTTREVEARVLTFGEPGPRGVMYAREAFDGKDLPPGCRMGEDGIYCTMTVETDQLSGPQILRQQARLLGIGRT